MFTAKEALEITNRAKSNPLNRYELMIKRSAEEGWNSVVVEGRIADESVKLLEEKGFKVMRETDDGVLRRITSMISW